MKRSEMVPASSLMYATKIARLMREMETALGEMPRARDGNHRMRQALQIRALASKIRQAAHMMAFVFEEAEHQDIVDNA